jgi:hypothetical protein
VAKFRERLSVSKQTTHRILMDRFNIKKLNQVECKEQCRVETPYRFAALEGLDDVDIKRPWKIIREKIKIWANMSK